MDDLKNHLQLVSSGAKLDNRLVENYVGELNSSLLPLINQILYRSDYDDLDAKHLLLDLLQNILQDFQFNDIINVYSEQFIIESLNMSDSVAQLICLKILTDHLHDDKLIDFLHTNNLIQVIIKQYLSSKNISTVNQLEFLVFKLINLSILSEDFFTPDLIDLYTQIRNGDDSTLIIRLLNYILLILPQLPQSFPKLYLVTQQDFDKFFDDPLFIVLLIDFYIKLIDTTIFLELTSSIDIILKNYHDYNSEVYDLLSKLSYTNNIDFVKQLVSKHKIFEFDNLQDIFQYSPDTIRLLSNFNPNLLLQISPDIYNQILKDLPLLSNQKYFPIILNLIQSCEFFNLLKQSYFDSSTLCNLSLDQLFQILLQFSRFTHTKKYLFNELPIVITTKLFNYNILNNDLYKTQIEILSNLLLPDSSLAQELEFWRLDLQKHLLILKCGKTIKEIVPQVEVMDETM